VAHRDRYFWVKLMLGTSLGVLVADLLVLAVLIVPLRASPQVSPGTRALSVRSTQAVVDQLLSLPTHDPSKPWPTRTPQPTATPWLVAAVKLATQRQAELASVRNAAMTAASSAGAAPASGSGDTSSQTMSSSADAGAPAGSPLSLARQAQVQLAGTPPGPTATSQTGAILAGTRAPTVVLPPSAEPSGTVTPISAAPSETSDAPTSVPSPTLLTATPEPSLSTAAGDEAQFTAYVQDHYNTIADQPLDIVAVTFAHPETGIPLVTVEVSGGTTDNVFAAQTADAVADYGRRLLNDAKSFCHSQPCAVSVVSKYETSDPDGCTRNPSWCYLRAYNEASQAWSVVWTYVVGTFDGGSDSVQTWNATS
jgi:hypothetical protein